MFFQISYDPTADQKIVGSGNEDGNEIGEPARAICDACVQISITSRVTQIVQLLKIFSVPRRAVPLLLFAFRVGREELKRIARFQCGDSV